MKLKVFVLRDTESKDFGKPMLFENDTLAVRYLHTLIESQQLQQYGDRFFLKCLAWYDTEIGNFVARESYALDWCGQVISTNELDEKLKFRGENYVKN